MGSFLKKILCNTLVEEGFKNCFLAVYLRDIRVSRWHQSNNFQKWGSRGAEGRGFSKAKPEIIKIQDYSKNTYKSSRDELNSLGIPFPKSPFLGD